MNNAQIDPSNFEEIKRIGDENGSLEGKLHLLLLIRSFELGTPCGLTMFHLGTPSYVMFIDWRGCYLYSIEKMIRHWVIHVMLWSCSVVDPVFSTIPFKHHSNNQIMSFLFCRWGCCQHSNSIHRQARCRLSPLSHRGHPAGVWVYVCVCIHTVPPYHMLPISIHIHIYIYILSPLVLHTLHTDMLHLS